MVKFLSLVEGCVTDPCRQTAKVVGTSCTFCVCYYCIMLFEMATLYFTTYSHTLISATDGAARIYAVA